jgi:hypothetical protein
MMAKENVKKMPVPSWTQIHILGVKTVNVSGSGTQDLVSILQ